jgi:hypothetical protein
MLNRSVSSATNFKSGKPLKRKHNKAKWCELEEGITRMMRK